MILIQLESRATAKDPQREILYRDVSRRNNDDGLEDAETRRAPPTKSTDNDDGDDDGLASEFYGSDSARPDAALEPRSD